MSRKEELIRSHSEKLVNVLNLIEALPKDVDDMTTEEKIRYSSLLSDKRRHENYIKALRK